MRVFQQLNSESCKHLRKINPKNTTSSYETPTKLVSQADLLCKAL